MSKKILTPEIKYKIRIQIKQHLQSLLSLYAEQGKQPEDIELFKRKVGFEMAKRIIKNIRSRELWELCVNII